MVEQLVRGRKGYRGGHEQTPGYGTVAMGRVG